MRAPHQLDERHVVQWLDQMDGGDAAQPPRRPPRAHSGSDAPGKRSRHRSRAAMCASAAQIPSKPAPKLSRRCAVTSISFLRGSSRRQASAPRAAPRPGVAHIQDGIDAGVACDQDRSGVTPSRRRFVGRGLGRREMQRGEPRRQHAIHLLGKRLAHVTGSQSGFHVATGIPRRKRPSAPQNVVVVSPWTITMSGARANTVRAPPVFGTWIAPASAPDASRPSRGRA